MDHLHFGYITKLTKKTLKFATLAKSQILTKNKTQTLNLFWSVLCCSQSGDGPQEYLARFGYKLNMKVIF
jgi:hypothetical protein